MQTLGSIRLKESGISSLVEIVEEGQSQTPSPACGFAGRGIDDSVERGAPFVVRPAPHQISKVDDKAILHKGHIVPDWIFLVLGHLQSRTPRSQYG